MCVWALLFNICWMLIIEWRNKNNNNNKQLSKMTTGILTSVTISCLNLIQAKLKTFSKQTKTRRKMPKSNLHWLHWNSVTVRPLYVRCGSWFFWNYFVQITFIESSKSWQQNHKLRATTKMQFRMRNFAGCSYHDGHRQESTKKVPQFDNFSNK